MMDVASLSEQGLRAPPALLPTLRQLCDLKRVRSAGRAGSIAERLFGDAWARVAGGEDVAQVARSTTFDALVATGLGDIDPETLAALGLPFVEINRIRRRAAEEAAAALDPGLRSWLLDEAPVVEAPAPPIGPPPPFVARLAAQPRAGAACRGRGRLVLEPPESHADHCALVAICGLALAPSWNARPETAFLAGLAHHLHNALLPDAGFAGEDMLGEWLRPVIGRATVLALQELAPGPRDRVEAARRILVDAGSPEGRAFHAADTLDRVLQVEHHLRASRTTMSFVLREMELVHAGPVKPFQDAVLTRMGLAA